MSLDAPSPIGSFEQRFAGPVGPLERFALAGLGFVLLMSVYVTVAARAEALSQPLHTLPTALDGWVPLWPPAVMVYGLLYMQVFVPLTLLVDRRVLLRGGLAYTLLVGTGLIFWVGYPVAVPRAPVPVHDLFTWGLALIRALDPPTNCFPSMHVAEAFLAGLVVRRMDRPLGTALLVSAAAIWWSTLALGQHWFVDGLAGLVMALAVDHLVFARWPLPAEALRTMGRRSALWAAGVYFAAFLAFAAPWWLGWQSAIDWVLGAQ